MTSWWVFLASLATMQRFSGWNKGSNSSGKQCVIFLPSDLTQRRWDSTNHSLYFPKWFCFPCWDGLSQLPFSLWGLVSLHSQNKKIHTVLQQNCQSYQNDCVFCGYWNSFSMGDLAMRVKISCKCIPGTMLKKILSSLQFLRRDQNWWRSQ